MLKTLNRAASVALVVAVTLSTVVVNTAKAVLPSGPSVPRPAWELSGTNRAARRRAASLARRGE